MIFCKASRDERTQLDEPKETYSPVSVIEAKGVNKTGKYTETEQKKSLH